MIACPELEMGRQSVKLDAELMRLAKIVAASRNISVIDYVESLITPLVRRDVARVKTELPDADVNPSPLPPAPKQSKKGGN